jgi:2-(1,2-epoxy-1,2-dihydrophenyl)acetyl-CoA isomerase
MNIEEETQPLLVSREDRVLILTLNRPERLNALTPRLHRELHTAVEAAAGDPDIGAVILTGAGRAFCSGGDMGVRKNSDSAPQSLEAKAQELCHHGDTAKLLRAIPKPTIAMMNGVAAGAGLALALACDLRIASENAVMTTAFARVGFSGDYGGTYFLSQLVGTGKAREMYFLSERIDMKEAERLGLVNWVVPGDALQQKTMDIARRLAAGPRVAYRYMKENLNRAAAGDMETCVDLEATHHIHTGLTEDHREAARAFVEKREPMFKGR